MVSRSADPRSDEALIDACNKASADAAAQAFEILYQRHRDYTLRIAMRFTHDRELAADVLQETFTYLLRQFPPTGGGLRLTARMTTFLYPIAKNFAISAARKARRFEASAEAPDELAAPGPQAPSDALDRALSGLSAERRETLTLRFVDGLTLEEIARALDIPLGTVKSRLHLALKQLRDDPKIKDLFAP